MTAAPKFYFGRRLCDPWHGQISENLNFGRACSGLDFIDFGQLLLCHSWPRTKWPVTTHEFWHRQGGPWPFEVVQYWCTSSVGCWSFKFDQDCWETQVHGLGDRCTVQNFQEYGFYYCTISTICSWVVTCDTKCSPPEVFIICCDLWHEKMCSFQKVFTHFQGVRCLQ